MKGFHCLSDLIRVGHPPLPRPLQTQESLQFLEWPGPSTRPLLIYVLVQPGPCPPGVPTALHRSLAWSLCFETHASSSSAPSLPPFLFCIIMGHRPRLKYSMVFMSIYLDGVVPEVWLTHSDQSLVKAQVSPALGFSPGVSPEVHRIVF